VRSFFKHNLFVTENRSVTEWPRGVRRCHLPVELESGTGYAPQRHRVAPSRYVFSHGNLPSRQLEKLVQSLSEIQLEKQMPTQAKQAGQRDGSNGGLEAINYDRITDQVYNNLMRRMRNERERLGL